MYMWKFLMMIVVATSLSCTQKEKKACCASGPEEVSHGHHGDHSGYDMTSMHQKPVTHSADSLYNVKTVWEDNNNKPVALSDFKNTPLLVTMTYTSCEYSCPLTLKKLEAIEKKIKIAKYKNYKIAVISFDTVRDTPERFRQYMKEKNLDPNRYVFLRSKDKSKIREIAVHLGINYKEESGNEFSHSNMITLLDKKGVIAQQINGIGGDPTDLINKLVQIK